ncbi:MAG: hypothetical protein ACOYMZ_02780 [Minisyncoccia bacterium]
MAHTTQITAPEKNSVVLFFLSIAYCIFLAVVPSVQTSPTGLFIAATAAIVWLFVFAEATKCKSAYPFFNIPTGIIWISLVYQAI